MTDIRKLAGKHARGFVDPKVKNAIVHALQEYQKSVVIDVLHSDPSTALVAERIVRNRPLPVHAGYNSVAVARITFKQLVEYAVEMGRELERRSQPEREQEYGWEWNSGPYPRKTFPVYGATNLAQAQEVLSQTIRLEHVTLMVRDKAAPGEWREA
ncbi:hypothetical protein SEA_ROMAN_101 [Microbacterium phage Roman]|nr:hypothetical protein SEA_ROMAN_101 [Microbacterium phage Roman]